MDSALPTRIKEVLVQSLRLPYPASEIADDVHLFGEGLGLDSIDALELVLAVERTFGVSISDEQTAKRVLQSVNTLAEFIVERGGGKFGEATASGA